ncbi:hypothetical protein [Devosia ginsengisoli]|uniref:Uncharacterized protein n=1 Tax=Devosia ginsengisoli TaxID=400770 RepID=A0A5B8LVV4_9HYPH|nr:hypothetical protein [Devosia ginsengisoli]QDZ12226.1 hypothetical protein FPZ08_16605 [Devosia ginsengisoli]
MYLLVTAILGAVGWFLFRRWRRNLPVDPRLTAAYWQKSAIVLAVYLLSILAGAGVTRIMVGFNRSGWADLLMVAFFAVWVLYGAVWLLRFLPTSKPRPAWLTRSRGWIDGAALALLAGLAAGARML